MPPPPQVALCVTCLVDQLLPEVGVASVKLLRRAGYQGRESGDRPGFGVCSAGAPAPG